MAIILIPTALPRLDPSADLSPGYRLPRAMARWMRDGLRRVGLLAAAGLESVATSDGDLAGEAFAARSLRRLGQGDHDAMAELYDRYAPTVFAMALRMLRDRQGAEEVVQECFWRVWRGADSFDGHQGSAGAWIYSIGRNSALDAMRRAKSRPAGPLDGPLDDWIADQADPNAEIAADVMQTMELAQVRAAVNGLDGDQRKVIEMSYFDGLTRREIAERTGVPIGTVHTRARLALGKLRLALAAPSTARDSAPSGL